MAINGRPRIALYDDKILHDGKIVKVVLRKDLITVGCTDVTPEALRFLLEKYDEQNWCESVLLQSAKVIPVP